MPVILTILQIIFVKFCKFTSKRKIVYIVPVIFLSIFYALYPFNGINSYSLFISYLIMIDLSISDICYREVDPKSYIPLLICGVITGMLYGFPISTIMSYMITQLLMFFYFKIGYRLGEEMGGADMKLMLILSLFYEVEDIFMFLLTALFLTVILAIFYSIKKRSLKVSTPMIVSITIAHIFVSLIYILGFRI